MFTKITKKKIRNVTKFEKSRFSWIHHPYLVILSHIIILTQLILHDNIKKENKLGNPIFNYVLSTQVVQRDRRPLKFVYIPSSINLYFYVSSTANIAILVIRHNCIRTWTSLQQTKKRHMEIRKNLWVVMRDSPTVDWHMWWICDSQIIYHPTTDEAQFLSGIPAEILEGKPSSTNIIRDDLHNIN